MRISDWSSDVCSSDLSRYHPPAAMPDAASAEPQIAQFDVLIVGSGFAGLCMAIRLRQAGHRFVLLEQAASLGGTWQANRYPGAACDIPDRKSTRLNSSH